MEQGPLCGLEGLWALWVKAMVQRRENVCLWHSLVHGEILAVGFATGQLPCLTPPASQGVHLHNVGPSSRASSELTFTVPKQRHQAEALQPLQMIAILVPQVVLIYSSLESTSLYS